MAIQRSLRRAAKIPILAAVAGSILGAILFCIAEIIDGSQFQKTADFLMLPGIGFLVGLSGLIVSLPCALAVGTPIQWFFESHFAASPARLGILLAIIGAILGWIFFKMALDDGLGIFVDASRHACPLFGAMIGGLHPPLTAWLLRPLPITD